MYIFDQGSKFLVYIFDHTVGTEFAEQTSKVYIFDQDSKFLVYNFDQGSKSLVYIFDQRFYWFRNLSVHFWSYCRNCQR